MVKFINVMKMGRQFKMKMVILLFVDILKKEQQILYNYNISKMVFNQLCPPALIYLIFSTTQVIIDSVKGLYNTALIKIWVAILFTILLNYLCSLGLGTISWLIVFIPFILMTLVVAVLLSSSWEPDAFLEVLLLLLLLSL